MIKENIDSVCFVGVITEVLEIPDADKIEQVKIGDWSCISTKGANKVGDKIVICTQDAVIPLEISEQFGVTNYLRKGQRVRTIKLKKTYSECLLLSFEKLNISSDFKEGDDLQNLLGIFKYEEPEKTFVTPGGQKVKFKDNPDFRVYTKFPNVKNAPDYFQDDEVVSIQRKIHGTNFRCGIVPVLKQNLWNRILSFFGKKLPTHEFIYGSHRVNISYRNNYTGFYNSDVYGECTKKYNLEEKLWSLFNNSVEYGMQNSIEIYGEIYGAGLQGEYNYNLDNRQAVFFDIQIDGKYLSPEEVDTILKTLDLPRTNCESLMRYKDFVLMKDKILSKKYPDNKNPEEGVVLKALVQGQENLRAVKVINPEYLIYADKNNIPDFH